LDAQDRQQNAGLQRSLGQDFRDQRHASQISRRLELAEREWARLKANDSLECRNCHGFAYMDFTRQGQRAVEMHSTFLAKGERTCIDCHKGIAHKLPDMTGVPGWDVSGAE
jgi:cytochrome c-type protein NapC